MKVLVTGVKGQLGYDVVRELEKRQIEAVGVDVEEMDITDAAQVETVIRNVNRMQSSTARLIQQSMRRRTTKNSAAG